MLTFVGKWIKLSMELYWKLLILAFHGFGTQNSCYTRFKAIPGSLEAQKAHGGLAQARFS